MKLSEYLGLESHRGEDRDAEKERETPEAHFGVIIKS